MVGIREYLKWQREFSTLMPTYSEYNARYFDDPEKFKPSRWHGVENESEAFTAFSVGSSYYIHVGVVYISTPAQFHRRPFLCWPEIRYNRGRLLLNPSFAGL